MGDVRSMRVLVFSERLAPPADEGIKKLTLSLADAFAQLGHTVSTLTTGGSDWPEHGVVDVPANRLLRSQALARRVAAFRPEAVVYVPTASLTLASGVRAGMLKRHAGGAPVALMATQGRHHHAAVRWAGRFARPDLCVVQSASTLAQAQALGWRVTRAPAAVDVETFHPASSTEKQNLRAQYGLPQNRPIVLHVGHLNRRRGAAELALVGDQAYPVLVASTSTPQDPALAAELRAAGVHLITHYVAAVAGLYRAADAYLFPTPPDPRDPSSIDMPLSVLEAAACDLPLLTTRFGALPELWAAQPGVVFYDDATGLRAGLQKLLAERPSTRGLVNGLTWRAVATHILATLRHSNERISDV